MDWTNAFLDDLDARADAKAQRERDQRDERTYRKAAANYQRREDRLLRDISEPSLERALERAAVGLTRHRMKDLEVKIGESLASQVKDGVRETFREMDRRGHRAYIRDEFGPQRDYVQSMTIILPEVAYRIYQRLGTWEWVG